MPKEVPQDNQQVYDAVSKVVTDLSARKKYSKEFGFNPELSVDDAVRELIAHAAYLQMYKLGGSEEEQEKISKNPDLFFPKYVHHYLVNVIAKEETTLQILPNVKDLLGEKDKIVIPEFNNRFDKRWSVGERTLYSVRKEDQDND